MSRASELLEVLQGIRSRPVPMVDVNELLDPNEPDFSDANARFDVLFQKIMKRIRAKPTQTQANLLFHFMTKITESMVELNSSKANMALVKLARDFWQNGFKQKATLAAPATTEPATVGETPK